MCYSAQIQAAYMKYLRETGAEMDIDQFVEIFGARVSDSSIRIPRAVERWFDEPKNDGERKIKAFIDQYRAAEITKLEREVFIAEEAPRRCRAHARVQAHQGRHREQAHRRQQDRAGHDAARAVESDQTACRRGAHLPHALRAHRSAGRRPARHAARPLSLPQAGRTRESSIGSCPASTTRGATAWASTGKGCLACRTP